MSALDALEDESLPEPIQPFSEQDTERVFVGTRQITTVSGVDYFGTKKPLTLELAKPLEVEIFHRPDLNLYFARNQYLGISHTGRDLELVADLGGWFIFLYCEYAQKQSRLEYRESIELARRVSSYIDGY